MDASRRGNGGGGGNDEIDTVVLVESNAFVKNRYGSLRYEAEIPVIQLVQEASAVHRFE
jgi:hypothetical protein